jgi:hypothetical protein
MGAVKSSEKKQSFPIFLMKRLRHGGTKAQRSFGVCFLKRRLNRVLCAEFLQWNHTGSLSRQGGSVLKMEGFSSPGGCRETPCESGKVGVWEGPHRLTFSLGRFSPIEGESTSPFLSSLGLLRIFSRIIRCEYGRAEPPCLSHDFFSFRLTRDLKCYTFC